MSESEYEHIVVGAGIQGSATAYELAKKGRRTLLIDQFPVGANRGSSQGGSRIIRRAYNKPFFAAMMDDAYNGWETIARESHDSSLFTKTGLLLVASPSDDYLDAYVDSFEINHFEYESVEGAQINERFPCFHFDESFKAVFDPSSGVLRADRCLTAIQKLFVSMGGMIQGGCRVQDVIPGKIVTLVTEDNRRFRSPSVVLCLGPWATIVLPRLHLNLPLKASQTAVMFWTEKEKGAASPAVFPNIIHRLSKDVNIFGQPSIEYPGKAKVCVTYLEPFDPSLQTPIDFDAVTCFIQPHIQRHFPKLEPTPSIKHECFYTKTPDGTFILDRHPQYSNIIVGTGFSGTGFKLAPVVGKILSALALNETPPYDISPFAISRF